jgi:hypothetical protein
MSLLTRPTALKIQYLSVADVSVVILNAQESSILRYLKYTFPPTKVSQKATGRP